MALSRQEAVTPAGSDVALGCKRAWVCAVAQVSQHRDSDAVGRDVIAARRRWAVMAPLQGLAAVTGEICNMTLMREERDGSAVPSGVRRLW